MANGTDDIVQRIVVEGADQAVSAFESIGQGATQAFSSITGAVQSLLGELGPIGAAAGATAGAFAGLALALEKVTEHASEFAASLRGLALLSGSSVEDMSALTSAFAAAGVGAEGLVTNFRRLAQRVSTDLPKVREEMKSAGDTIASAQLKAQEATNALNKVMGESLTFNERDLAQKKAQIAASEAQRAAQQAQANDIRKFVQYFDDLAKGVKTSTDGMNLSLENLRKGLVGSLGDASQLLKDFDGSMRRATDPSIQQQILKLADIFQNMPDGVNKTALAVQLFGRSAGPGLIAFLNQGAAAIQAEMDRLKALGVVVTDIESDKLKKFRIASFQLSDSLEILRTKFAAAISPAFTEALEKANHFLEEHTDDIVKLGDTTLKVLGKLGDAWTAILPAIKAFAAAINIASDAGAALIDWGVKLVNLLTDPLVAALRAAVEWVKSFGDAAVTSFNQVLSVVNTVIAAVSRLLGLDQQAAAANVGGTPAEEGSGLPMAAGGFVRGPAGIDRVPAMLTAGEYVLSRNAVNRLGVGFLHALNMLRVPRLGFDMGGLVGSLPRFASGGLVSAPASSGRALYLTIEGRSFSGMTATETTAMQLERFAVHSQLASTGRKQSWRR